jgi:hypothetical protein
MVVDQFGKEASPADKYPGAFINYGINVYGPMGD